MNLVFKSIGLSIVTVFCLAACQSSNLVTEENTSLSLAGQVWQLTTLAGKPITLDKNKTSVSIEFSPEEATYSGFAGCNNYRGRYKASEHSIEIAPAMATRKFCQHLSEQERKFFNALHTTDNYNIVEKKLTLIGNSNQILAVFNSK